MVRRKSGVAFGAASREGSVETTRTRDPARRGCWMTLSSLSSDQDIVQGRCVDQAQCFRKVVGRWGEAVVGVELEIQCPRHHDRSRTMTRLTSSARLLTSGAVVSEVIRLDTVQMQTCSCPGGTVGGRMDGCAQGMMIVAVRE